MLLGCPANFTDNNAVVNEIFDKFFSNSVKTSFALHNRSRHIKRLQVLHERTRVRLLCEPFTQTARIIYGSAGRIVDRQRNPFCLRNLQYGAGAKTSIEMIVERHFGKRLDVVSGQ